jgi:hypothetical protein
LSLVLLNQGLREKIDEGSGVFSRNAITDDNGDQVSSPALLNDEGGKLNNPYPDAAIFLCWEQFEAKDFSVLPLT